MPPMGERGEEKMKKGRMAQMKKKELALPEPKKGLKKFSSKDAVKEEEADIGEIQRALTKRNFILKRLASINERVQQVRMACSWL